MTPVCFREDIQRGHQHLRVAHGEMEVRGRGLGLAQAQARADNNPQTRFFILSTTVCRSVGFTWGTIRGWRSVREE